MEAVSLVELVRSPILRHAPPIGSIALSIVRLTIQLAVIVTIACLLVSASLWQTHSLLFYASLSNTKPEISTMGDTSGDFKLSAVLAGHTSDVS